MQYNRNLDLKLEYPLPRPNDYHRWPQENLLEQLLRCSKNYFFNSELYNKNMMEIDELHADVLQKEKAVEAFETTISMFDEQMAIIDASIEKSERDAIEADAAEASENESKLLKANRQILVTKIEEINQVKEGLRQKMTDSSHLMSYMRKQVNLLKPEILSAHKEREHLQKTLVWERGIDTARLSSIAREAELQARTELEKRVAEEEHGTSYRRKRRSTCENAAEKLIEASAAAKRAKDAALKRDGITRSSGKEGEYV